MRAGLARFDHRVSVGLLRFLRRPAAFLAANWAALLGVLSLVGLVPALAGATRTTAPGADTDTTFTDTLSHMRATWRRDLLATVALWAFLLMLVGDVVILATWADAATRVFLVGLLAPVAWVVTAWLTAYVATAVDPALTRGEVARGATERIVRSPLRALVSPALVLILSPAWLLAPITIAVGLSLPAWVLGRWWSPQPVDRAVRGVED